MAGSREGLRALSARGRAAVALGAALGVLLGLFLVTGATPAPSLPTALAIGAAETSRGTGMIVGRVLREDGTPAAGIRVAASLPTAAKRDSVNPSFLATDTDAKGEYRLEDASTASWDVFVWADPVKEEVAVARPGIGAIDGQTTRVLDMVLTRGATITGKVLDRKTRAPVEGVTVAALGTDRPPTGGPAASTLTNAEGSFSIRVAPGYAEVYAVPTAASGLSSDEIRGWLESNRPRVYEVKDLALAETRSVEIEVNSDKYRTGILSGRVLYEDGRPAPGIKLYAWGKVDESAESHGSAVTAADGTYRLVVMKDVPHTLVVWEMPDGWVARAAVGRRGKLDEVTRVPDLVFTRGALVEGTVRDRRTGKPLAGVYISSFGPHRPKSTHRPIGVKTDAAGHYAMRLAPGSCQVHWDGPFRRDVLDRVFGSRRFEGEELELDQKMTPLQLKAGETKQLDFSVDGSLLDPDRK